MPCAYQIDPARGVVFIRFWGTLTEQLAVELGRAMRSDPRFRPEYMRLGDLRAVTEFTLSIDAVDALARRVAFPASVRRAFVVSQPAMFGVARMFGALAGADSTFLVTRDIADAVEWVGLDRATAWPDDIIVGSPDVSD